MGYATAGSKAQVNEYLVLRLQQQTDLPISMPTSSAAFAALQIVVANFLFQSGRSLHIICTYCSSAIEVCKQLAITAVEGVCPECHKTLMQQQFARIKFARKPSFPKLEQHSTLSEMPTR
jgi:hypothetical protein